jgi:hypothetical protein
MMAVAGCSHDAIGRFLNTSSATVNYHLQKPRVQAHMLALQATFVEDMRSSAQRMNERLEGMAHKALDVQEATMEDMDRRRSNGNIKEETQIKAATLAITTAQDILDRAYGKAPKRIEVESHTTHAIDPAGAELIASAIRESEAVDVTPHHIVRDLSAEDSAPDNDLPPSDPNNR